MRIFVIKLIGETGLRFCSAVFIFLLARNLGAVHFGIYSTAFAFASLFVIIADLGMNNIVMREIARDIQNRHWTLGSANLIKLGSSLVALAGIHLVGRWSSFARENTLLVDALGVVVVGYAFADYLAALLCGKEDIGWEAFLKTLCRAIVVSTGIIVIYLTKSLLAVMIAMACASGVSVLVGMLIVRYRFGRFGTGIQPEIARKILLSSLPLLGSFVFWTFYDNQDVLLLRYFHTSDRDIGLFFSASKVIDVAKVIPILLAGTFFPILARFAQARESFLETARTLFTYAFLLIPIVIVGIYLMSPMLMTVLYGREFVEGAPFLRVLLGAYFGIFMNQICMQILIAKDLETHLLPGAAIACLANLALCWWLIPRYGPMGVCYALVLTEAIYLAFQARLVHRAVPELLNPFRRTYG